jgi:hypothetical protein
MTDEKMSENSTANTSLGIMPNSFFMWDFLRKSSEIIMNHPVYKKKFYSPYAEF